MLIKHRNNNLEVPELEIKGEKVQEASLITYLGDVFNNKGNNDDLVADRVKRGTVATISIHGFMREASLGTHTLNIFILLHNSIFTPSVIFNSEAWSNITDKNVAALTTVQTRYLKKMMGVRQATANSLIYLELGVLPIKYEIHKRQISFLHHIIHLRDDDPVKMVWRNQTQLPEHNNWWCGVKSLMKNYDLQYEEEEIKKISKQAFKKQVKIAVNQKAFEDLRNDCESKKKTQNIRYTKFETQEYIKVMYPGAAKTIFKCRAKTLNIKEHTQYKHVDFQCRWCGVCDETLEHVANCGINDGQIINVEKTLQEMNIDELHKVVLRVDDFLSRVEV